MQEQVSNTIIVTLLSLKKLLQDIKQKVPVMEAQYKMVTRTAQLVSKEIPQEEVSEMLGTVSGIKGQLSKVVDFSPFIYKFHSIYLQVQLF